MTDLRIGEAMVPVDPEPKLCELPKDIDDLIFEYGLAADDRGYHRALKDLNKAGNAASRAERYRLRLRRAIRALVDEAVREATS